jgi:hypothetical protein
MNVSETDLKLVCQGIISERSRGIFYGDNPLDHSTPTVLAQLSLSSLLSALTQYILTPLGESAFISMLLVKSLFFSYKKESKILPLVMWFLQVYNSLYVFDMIR